MYLPSRLKSKQLALFALFLFLLILPFKDVIEHIFVYFCDHITIDLRKSSQISELKEENLKLSLQNKELQRFQEENVKLKKILQFKQERRVNIVGAEIISFDPSSWRRIVIIDAGQDAGVNEGLFAIDEEGWLLGKIIKAKESYSYLMLVSDPDFNLPVIVGKDSFGLLQGGLERIKVLYIENGQNLKIKDKVRCRIPSLYFPLYVGEIRRVTKNKNNLFWDVEVNLFSQNISLRNIFIIK